MFTPHSSHSAEASTRAEDRTLSSEERNGILLDLMPSVVAPLVKQLSQRYHWRDAQHLEQDLLIALDKLLLEGPAREERFYRTALRKRVIDSIRADTGKSSVGRTKFYRDVQRAEEELRQEHLTPAVPQHEIAEKLGMPLEKFHRLRARESIASPVDSTSLPSSYDATLDETLTTAHMKRHKGPDVDCALLADEYLSLLPRGSREVIRRRFSEDASLKEIGREQGVTDSAISLGISSFIEAQRSKILALLNPEDREAAYLLIWNGLEVSEVAEILGTELPRVARILVQTTNLAQAAVGLSDRPAHLSSSESEVDTRAYLSLGACQLILQSETGKLDDIGWTEVAKLADVKEFFRDFFERRELTHIRNFIIERQGAISPEDITPRAARALGAYLKQRFPTFDNITTANRPPEPLFRMLGAPFTSVTQFIQRGIELNLFDLHIPKGHPFSFGNRLSRFLDKQFVGEELAEKNLRSWLNDTYASAAEVGAHRGLSTLLQVPQAAEQIRRVVLRKGLMSKALPDNHQELCWEQCLPFLEAETVGKEQAEQNILRYFERFQSVEDIGRLQSIVPFLGLPRSRPKIAREVLKRGYMPSEVKENTPLTLGARLNFYYDENYVGPEQPERNLGIYLRSTYPAADRVSAKDPKVAELLGVKNQKAEVARAILERGLMPLTAPADSPLYIGSTLNPYYDHSVVGQEQAKQNLLGWLQAHPHFPASIPNSKPLFRLLGTSESRAEARFKLLEMGIIHCG